MYNPVNPVVTRVPGKVRKKYRTKANRAKLPFIAKNRADINHARDVLGCEKCGCKGPPVLLLPPPGGRYASHLVWSSRAAFLRALAVSRRVCLNCDAIERGGMRKAPRNRKVKLLVHLPASQVQEREEALRNALAEQGEPEVDLQNVTSDLAQRVSEIRSQQEYKF